MEKVYNFLNQYKHPKTNKLQVSKELISVATKEKREDVCVAIDNLKLQGAIKIYEGDYDRGILDTYEVLNVDN